MEFVFEWDDEKARSSLRKHQVSFDDAATVFHDPFIATMLDPDHSDQGKRYIGIGNSSKGQLLVVIFTEREGKTRIISCRKATPSERGIYKEHGYY